ncbi:MAG TPA: hypothetical protein VI894_00830 [Candidatus Nanoarchaeia archaeon]|nr:hypothetical protein [Candidatus Nanoarchaeia archaeon]
MAKKEKEHEKNEVRKESAGMSREEQIGFHKGSLSTLAKERQEFLRMLSIVEQLMNLHLKSLQDLGVDLEKEAQKEQKSKKPIEDLLK